MEMRTFLFLVNLFIISIVHYGGTTEIRHHVVAKKEAKWNLPKDQENIGTVKLNEKKLNGNEKGKKVRIKLNNDIVSYILGNIEKVAPFLSKLNVRDDVNIKKQIIKYATNFKTDLVSKFFNDIYTQLMSNQKKSKRYGKVALKDFEIEILPQGEKATKWDIHDLLSKDLGKFAKSILPSINGDLSLPDKNGNTEKNVRHETDIKQDKNAKRKDKIFNNQKNI